MSWTIWVVVLLFLSALGFFGALIFILGDFYKMESEQYNMELEPINKNAQNNE